MVGLWVPGELHVEVAEPACHPAARNSVGKEHVEGRILSERAQTVVEVAGRSHRRSHQKNSGLRVIASISPLWDEGSSIFQQNRRTKAEQHLESAGGIFSSNTRLVDALDHAPVAELDPTVGLHPASSCLWVS